MRAGLQAWEGRNRALTPHGSGELRGSGALPDGHDSSTAALIRRYPGSRGGRDDGRERQH